MWPAGPSSPILSPWSGAAQAAALCPAGGRVVRDNRPSASSPRPAAKATSRTTAAWKETGCLWGCALVFDTWMTPSEVSNGPGRNTRVIHRAGSLDVSLALIKAGQGEVQLKIDHDNPADWASTKDGSLSVWIEGNQLRFRVGPETATGRLAIGLARSLTEHREASTLIYSAGHYLCELGIIPLMTITTGVLTEINLVPRGACPGTWVRAE
jgi:hypothetical protein